MEDLSEIVWESDYFWLMKDVSLVGCGPRGQSISSLNDCTGVHHDEGFTNATHVEDAPEPSSKEYIRTFEGMENGDA